MLGRVDRRLLGMVRVPDEVAGGRRAVPDSCAQLRSVSLAKRLSFGSWNQKVDLDAFIAPRPEANGRSTLIVGQLPLFLWGMGETRGTGMEPLSR